MKTQELNLDAEIFDDFREKMNIAIKATVRNIIGKKLEIGNVSAKIKITIREEATEDGELIYTPVFEPKVSIALVAKGEIECRKLGGFLMKQDGADGYVIGSSQVSIDELLDGKEEAG